MPIKVAKYGLVPPLIPNQVSKSLVAPVRKTKLIHIGAMNNVTRTAFLLIFLSARKYASGYPINKQISVVCKATKALTNKTLILVQVVKKPTNDSKEKLPFASVNA